MEIVGLSEEKVKKISEIKNESDWVLDYRLKGYKSFVEQSLPLFGPEINLNFDDVIYYKNNEADKKLENNWNNILKPVVDELDSVGVLESEKHFRRVLARLHRPGFLYLELCFESGKNRPCIGIASGGQQLIHNILLPLGLQPKRCVSRCLCLCFCRALFVSGGYWGGITFSCGRFQDIFIIFFNRSIVHISSIIYIDNIALFDVQEHFHHITAMNLQRVPLLLDVTYEDVFVSESLLGFGIFPDLNKKKVISHIKGFRGGFHRGLSIYVLCTPFYRIHLLGVLSPGSEDGG